MLLIISYVRDFQDLILSRIRNIVRSSMMNLLTFTLKYYRKVLSIVHYYVSVGQSYSGTSMSPNIEYIIVVEDEILPLDANELAA